MTSETDGIDSEYEHLRGIDMLRTQALDRIGDLEPVCHRCGEVEPLVLQRCEDGVCCYECAATAVGRARVEAHHSAGRLNSDETIAIPGNDHRMLSAAQTLWPIETLRNPHQSPLLTIAAVLRGWLDILRHVIHHSVGWIPDALERLNELLTELHGPTWWAPTAVTES